MVFKGEVSFLQGVGNASPPVPLSWTFGCICAPIHLNHKAKLPSWHVIQFIYNPSLTYGHERWMPNWCPLVGWLDSASERGVEHHHLGGAQSSHYFSISTGVSCGGLGIWSRCHLSASLQRFSGSVPLEGDPSEEPELTKRTVYLVYLTNGFPSMTWNMLLGKGCLGFAPGPVVPCNPTQISRGWWIDGMSVSFVKDWSFGSKSCRTVVIESYQLQLCQNFYSDKVVWVYELDEDW